MISLKGIYKNGKVQLYDEIKTEDPVEVIVTFLEDIEKTESKKLDIDKFSFQKSRELLKDYKGSLSEAVINERRSAM